MRTLRILLSLLLCLTVPVAGWASVLSGPDCPPAHAAAGVHHHLAGAPAHHHAMGLAVVAGPTTTVRQHSHQQSVCGVLAAHLGTCKGGHCNCGCGMGACAMPALSLTAPMTLLLLSHAPDGAVTFAQERPRACARGALPLRPPIS